jgi:N-acetylneuraminic acid mutarotase
MKTVMTNKVRKILGRLKPGLRRPAKSTGLFRKDGVHLKLTFIVNFKCTLTFDI